MTETTSVVKAIPWRGGEKPMWHEKRPCPFVIEIERDGKRHDLTCRGNPVNGRGGPAICAYLMTDHERGDICDRWYHMLEIPVELATNCCWNFQMLVAGCVGWRTFCGKQQPYFAVRKHNWDRDVHRCYEEPMPKFCLYCGAEIRWKSEEEP